VRTLAQALPHRDFMPRPLLLLTLGGFLWGLSLLVQEPDAEKRLASESIRLQLIIDRLGEEVQRSAERHARLVAETGPQGWMHEQVADLEAEHRASGQIILGFVGDSLACWSGAAPPRIHELLGDTMAHVRMNQAMYLHARVSVGLLELHVLRPVLLTPPIENRHLRRGFHPSISAPPGLLAASDAGTGNKLRDAQDQVMFGLFWRDGALEVGNWLHLKLALVVMAAICLLLALWIALMRVAHDGRHWLAAATFLAVLLAARYALLAIPTPPFDRLAIFDPALYATSFAFPSLGDLLINAALLVVVGLFLRRSLRGAYLAHGGIVADMAIWSMILLFATWTTSMVVGLVENSSVDLDLYHVEGFSGSSAAGLISVALLFTAWLLVANTLLHLLMPHQRSRNVFLSGLLVLGVSAFLHKWAGERDVLLILWPVAPLYLLLRGHNQRLRFLHVVLGLGVLAAVSAHLLTEHTHSREQRERQVMAERLATREDPVVELMFREVAPRLRNDPIAHALLTGAIPCGPGDLDQLIRQRYFVGYWERYDIRLFGFDASGRVRCSTDAEPPRSFSGMESAFMDPAAVADMPDLFIEEQPGRSPYYHARLAVMPREDMTPALLILELSPRSVSQGLGFPELLLAGQDPIGRRSERYAQARYENGRLVERSGNYPFPLDWTRQLGDEGMLWFTEEGYEHLAKGDPNGTLMVLSLPLPGLLDRATTFSYLFALFSLLLAIAMVLQTLVKRRGLPALGIGAKVRVALVLFSIAGLVFFGMGTQRLLARQYAQRSEAALLEKARSVHTELQQRFDGEPRLNASHVPYLEHLLGRYSNVFFTDITVYDVHGRLLASSRPQIFASGLLGRHMDPTAYERVVLSGFSSFVHEEAIGQAAYRAAYVPLRDRQGQVLAYLALPSFADQAQLEEERAGVLVAVVNLFVLLFALSILVAVFISNWTTRPLDLLKRALSGVALQGANTPIRYRGDDEIGQLVEVYNSKVEELRESAERLARSERESAWREMARQVAHEIKNPLTPMKLSIQHFQRTWAPDAPEATQKLERFSKGLVEQIDTLSGIASAFSNFAQMPRAQAEDLDLAELAEAAMSVFRATPGVTCRLERSSDGPLPVHADREQLMRVFNNLLKNAVQSIPDGRDGEVRVVLRSNAGEAIAEVHDNGSGIAEADKERIFRPNFTTKSSGMGLGLAMVQRMVETAGGRVWFETEEGTGSAFFIALPLRK
jgi:two-component system nitrogen regulation sensor histidine kinase NtrY